LEVYSGDEEIEFTFGDVYGADRKSRFRQTIVNNNNNNKQSLWRGCAALLGVIAAIGVVIYGISEQMDTDFGLPLLFREGTNMADLMYVAKNFKSDMLALGNSGGSSTTPDPGPDSSVFPSISPTSTLIVPTGLPTPVADPSPFPSSSPICEPSSSPSLSVSVAPSGQLDLASTESTLYQVYACYGIDVQQENIDTTPTAKVNAETFGRYAEQGLLSDLQELCDYLSANKDYMEVSMADSDCIYYQLMSVSVDDDREIDVFERVGLWMSQKKERFFQVGVEETGGGVVSGNFGEDLDLWLTFVCQPIPCQAEISSFFKHPDHALTMIDRWDDAVYDEGSASADSMGVISLTASDAWLFPLLSNRIVSSIYISSMISFVGCLVLISVATRNLKLSLLIGFGMLFVMITSLLLHVIFFSSVIDLIDIIVLISFVGIIIDYPTHMAFHYEQNLRLRNQLGNDAVHKMRFSDVGGRLTLLEAEEIFHKKSFGYMRLALIGPAITTIFSAIPLMFAEFSILSKAGEYVVIMCLCTYVYVAFVMPTLLRLVGELVFIPCRYTPEKSLYFIS
jgi:hypothetical protein